jgi:hypothetical protein
MEGSGRALLEDGALEAAIQAVELLTQQNGALFHDLAMLRDTIAQNDDDLLTQHNGWESQTAINMRLMQLPTGHARALQRALELEQRAILVGAPYDFSQGHFSCGDTAKARIKGWRRGHPYFSWPKACWTGADTDDPEHAEQEGRFPQQEPEAQQEDTQVEEQDDIKIELGPIGEDGGRKHPTQTQHW